MKLFEIFGEVKVNIDGAINKLKETDRAAESTGAKMEQLSNKMSDIGGKFTAAGATMSAAFTLPVAAAGSAAVKIGAEFEQSMANVKAISGATEGEFESLTKKAREMGRDTMFSATQSAEALSYMGMAGWEADQMISGLPGIMNLAAASGEDLASVSDIVTDAITAFGDKAQDAGRYADVLTAAATSANTNVGMLGESFKYVGPVAGALGFSLEDTAVGLSLMANAGIKASSAGTSMRSFLTNLTTGSGAAGDAMEELGISLTDSSGRTKSLETVMKELRVSFEDLTEAEKAETAASLAGKEGMSGLLAIVGATDEEFSSLTNSINDSSGAAQEIADIMADTLQGRVLEMKSAFEDLAITVYDNLEPVLSTLAVVATNLAKLFGNIPGPIQVIIITLAVLLAAIGPALMIFGMMASGLSSIISLFTVMPGLMAAMGAASGILTGILSSTLGLILSPAGLIIIGIAAVIAAGVLLYKNWDKIKEAAKSLMTMLRKTFKSIKEFLTNPIESAKKVIDKAFGGIFKLFDKFKSVKDKIFGKRGKDDPLEFDKDFEVEYGASETTDSGEFLVSRKKENRFFAKGGFMDNPTEFARSANFSYIGGEAGSEGIVPLEGRHMRPMAEAVAEIVKDKIGVNEGSSVVNNINVASMVVREQADIRRIAEELERMTERKNRLRGSS